jgi:hypothetical protein
MILEEECLFGCEFFQTYPRSQELIEAPFFRQSRQGEDRTEGQMRTL